MKKLITFVACLLTISMQAKIKLERQGNIQIKIDKNNICKTGGNCLTNDIWFGTQEKPSDYFNFDMVYGFKSFNAINWTEINPEMKTEQKCRASVSPDVNKDTTITFSKNCQIHIQDYSSKSEILNENLGKNRWVASSVCDFSGKCVSQLAENIPTAEKIKDRMEMLVALMMNETLLIVKSNMLMPFEKMFLHKTVTNIERYWLPGGIIEDRLTKLARTPNKAALAATVNVVSLLKDPANLLMLSLIGAGTTNLPSITGDAALEVYEKTANTILNNAEQIRTTVALETGEKIEDNIKTIIKSYNDFILKMKFNTSPEMFKKIVSTGYGLNYYLAAQFLRDLTEKFVLKVTE